MIQRTMDKIATKAFLWAFPSWVRPNHLTVARLLLIPVILVLLGFGHGWWALGVFLAATCTDFIDGAMARQRRQISTFGVYVDPIADKLLVGAVLAWVGYHYLVVQIFLAFIVLELVLTGVGATVLLRAGSSSPSNVFGKAKMTVQSVALLLFLIARFLDLDGLLDVSLYLLWLALALAAISGGKQILDVVRKRGPESKQKTLSDGQ
jgi:CDP-diacylglycerol--glycerol-3-phosphate 3-phosphatidyltransferase